MIVQGVIDDLIEVCEIVFPAADCCPKCSTPVGNTVSGGPSYSDAVDVYNIVTGAWSTAKLSVARGYLAAASVGNAALFAGGKDSVVDCILYFSRCNCF
jgi:hypothetical protein